MKRNLFVSIILVFLFSIIIFGCSKKGYRSIKVFNTSGNVDIVRNKKTIDAVKDMKLKNNDKVIVDSQSNAVLKLDNDKYVMVKENTTLTLQATGKSETSKTRIVVDKGGVVVEVKEKLNEKESFEIASSNSVMAIRGTQISFEVEVKDNKITTSVAVLEGTTEILLYKDQKLSSTTLNKDFKLSYTTDLSEVAKDISKVIKKGKVEEINDTILENVFNVVKEELTSEEIDDIVDTINTFERDDDLVNGVIKFKFINSPKYGKDPSKSIEIEETYRSLVGLKYTYSSTIDGEYKEFDLDNPLEIGTYYCKITAGNAYKSEPLKFDIVEVNLSFSFSSNPELGVDPSTLIVLENKDEYESLVYLYSKTIDGEYAEFDSTNPLEIDSYYCKIIADGIYVSEPVLFSVSQINLNLNIEFSQSIFAMSDVSADLIIKIDNDEFFNSDIAKELDSNMQPVNYIVCKVKQEGEDKYYFGELNYRNKEIVFDRTAFIDSTTSGRGDFTANVEFEYVIDERYNVTNDVEQSYVFESELLIDNFIVYYNPISMNYYFRLERGAFTADDYGSGDFDEYCCLQMYKPDGTPTRIDTDIYDYGSGINPYYEIDLDSHTEFSDNGVYTFDAYAKTSLGGDPGNIVLSHDKFTIDLNNFDTSKPRPYLNVGGSDNYILTYNNDGTINIYVDLQYGLEIQSEQNALGDYLVIYNSQNSSAPDKYVRGNGRFLKLEHIAYDDYIIKNIFAVDKEVDGVTYALSTADETLSFDIRSKNYSVNRLMNEYDEMSNRLSFMGGFMDSDVTLTPSVGEVETRWSSDADSPYYNSSVNYVIVSASYLSRVEVDIFNSICGTDFTTNVELDEENFTLLQNNLKTRYDLDIIGFGSGTFIHKLYFTTGDVQ